MDEAQVSEFIAKYKAEQSAPLQVGEVVALRSGGMPMTVIGTTQDGTQARCFWLADSGQGAEMQFPQAALIRCAPRPRG